MRPRKFDEERVLNLAETLFWRNGYSATSISQLADAMKMGPQSIYGAFKDKRTLFIRVLERYHKRRASELQSAFEAEPDIRKAIRKHFTDVARYHAEYQTRRSCFGMNSSLELSAHDADVAKPSEMYFSSLEEIFYHALHHSQCEGQLAKSKNIKALARLFTINTMGFGAMGVTRPDIALSDSIDLLLSLLE